MVVCRRFFEVAQTLDLFHGKSLIVRIETIYLYEPN